MNYKQLKELGYEGPESLYEVQAWIRKKYNLHLELFYSLYNKSWSVNNYIIDLKKSKRASFEYKIKSFSTYDEALLYSLETILNFIK